MKGFCHPKGYYSMFSILFFERLSYHGFGALFMVLLLKVLMMSPDTAYALRSNFISILFVVPVIGGIIADKYFGYKRSLYIAVISAGLGNFIIALHAIWLSSAILYTALIFLGIGYAFFRPALYVMIGSIYEDKNDPRRDSGFTLLYFATNLGAFFSPFMVLFVGENLHWWAGFLLAGLFSFAALPIIRKLDEPKINKAEALNLTDRQRTYVLVVIAVVVFLIWGVLTQTATILGDVFTNMSASEGSISKVRWVQLLNGGFLGVILVPIFAWVWVKLSSVGKEPTTLKKMFLGLALATVTMLGFYIIFADYQRTGKINVLWLAIFSVIFTSAELCIGPVAMSFVTKLAPSKLGATVLGVWFLLNFMLNRIASEFVPGYTAGKEFYIFLYPALIALITAFLIIVAYRTMSRWSNGVK